MGLRPSKRHRSCPQVVQRARCLPGAAPLEDEGPGARGRPCRSSRSGVATDRFRGGAAAQRDRGPGPRPRRRSPQRVITIPRSKTNQTGEEAETLRVRCLGCSRLVKLCMEFRSSASGRADVINSQRRSPPRPERPSDSGMTDPAGVMGSRPSPSQRGPPLHPAVPRRGGSVWARRQPATSLRLA
jgi:hypothetical protein